jgi:hypothetical protein
MTLPTQNLMPAIITKDGDTVMIEYQAMPFPLPVWAQDKIKQALGGKRGDLERIENAIRQTIGRTIRRPMIAHGVN